MPSSPSPLRTPFVSLRHPPSRRRFLQAVAYGTTQSHPPPNLFVSMRQHLGLDENRFASSLGTMRGRDLA